MRTWIAAACVVSTVFIVGCTSDDQVKHEHKMTHKKMAATQSAGADDCTMCEGMQTASADGTCPVCNMKMK